MRAHIVHTTEYNYQMDATDSFNELRLQPMHSESQSVLESSVRVSVAQSSGRELPVPLQVHTDYFGTIVHHAHVREPHRKLIIQARSVVETRAAAPLPIVEYATLTSLRDAWLEYIEPSKRIPTGAWLSAVNWFAPLPQTDLGSYLMDLTLHLYSRFKYESGVTKVDTPLIDFIQDGRGVCQDYAHAMVAVCREAGIPARYVSGYIDAGSQFVGAEATHAWIEAFMPSVGWVGFDATNQTRAGEAHIKIGHGRDYDDVPPVRGVRRGGGAETLAVDVLLELQQ
jgi:transglutaminase-like putative cysteine protease